MWQKYELVSSLHVLRIRTASGRFILNNLFEMELYSRLESGKENH